MKSVTSINSVWNNLSGKELRDAVQSYYVKNLTGKVVRNKDRGFQVQFTNQPGRNKLARGGAMNVIKANATRALIVLISEGIFSNWGNRKVNDNSEVLGYYNLKSALTIDGRKHHVRIAIQVRKNGRLYYTHSVNNLRVLKQ